MVFSSGLPFSCSRHRKRRSASLTPEYVHVIQRLSEDPGFFNSDGLISTNLPTSGTGG
jgi:hypothetical protein